VGYRTIAGGVKASQSGRFHADYSLPPNCLAGQYRFHNRQQWGQVLSFASPRRGAMAFIRLALQESRPDPGGSGGFLLSLKLRALALLAARTG
jgi:hypothetical protein